MVSSCVAAGALAYAASAVTIVALYPYRDLVKHFSYGHMSHMHYGEFVLSRYRGMLYSPAQPLMLAVPHGGLYAGYVAAGGGVAGAALGGALFGCAKTAVGTVAYRMQGRSERYNRAGCVVYKSVTDCIVMSARYFGVLSFLVGATAASLIAMLWHGTALLMLQQQQSQQHASSSLSSFAQALRVHAFLTFATNPLRNTFRSALYQRERAGGVRDVRGYAAAEAAVYREAVGVFQAMLRSQGVRFFLEGVLRTTFKTSVPFACTYALFVGLGGSLGPAARSREHHGHGHGHRLMRRAW